MDPVQNPESQSVSPPVSGLSPAPKPKSSSKFLIIIAVLVVLLLSSLGVVYFLQAQKNNTTPTPITQISPSPTPDPTADWKTYSGEWFSFKYPQDWYIENEVSANEQYPYIRVQNYNPIGAPARGYDSVQDKGKYAIVTAKIAQTATTIKDLQNVLEMSDKKAEPALGKRFISNEKAMMVNGYDALYREVALEKPTNFSNPEVYIINEKGTVIKIFPSLDVEWGRNYFDQVLSTFKFSD